MVRIITPDVGLPAGDDWWPSFINAQATADLAKVGSPLYEIGSNGAMAMLRRAHREALHDLVLLQPEIAEKAGELAVDHQLHMGIYN